MSASFEELKILQDAETVADSIWKEVIQWEKFAKDTVGKQLVRAVDSVGANIAEAFDRFHYGEKLQFLYYARGSLFETKYWLNRAISRQLIQPEPAEKYIAQLTSLARQLNSFAKYIKSRRASKSPKSVREIPVKYTVTSEDDPSDSLFSDADLDWLQSTPPNT